MKRNFVTIILILLLASTMLSILMVSAQIEAPMTIEGYVFIRSAVTGENLTAPAGLKIYVKIGTEMIEPVEGSQDVTDENGYYAIGISGPPSGTKIDLWVQQINVTRITLVYMAPPLELNLTVVDTVPPTAPVDLMHISPLNDTTPSFTWTASTDNLRVEGYYVQITNYPVYWIGNTTSWESPDELPEGNYTLNVWAKDLAGNNGTKASLKFTIRTAPILPPEVTITNPTTTNPVYTRSGTTIQVTYRYTEASPKNATITVYNSTYSVAATIIDLAGGTNITRTDSITIPAGTAEGSYNLNVTVYNIYELSKTATQTDAIKVDITAPTITSVSQNPPANNVQPTDTVEVTATVTDALSGVKNVTLYYSKDGGATWNLVPMQPNGQLYKGTIPPLPADTTVKYYIEAFDKAGNKKISPETEYYIYTVIPEFPNILAILLILSATILIAAAIKWRKPSQQPPFL
jgi:hypothetical protein